MKEIVSRKYKANKVNCELKYIDDDVCVDQQKKTVINRATSNIFEMIFFRCCSGCKYDLMQCMLCKFFFHI